MMRPSLVPSVVASLVAMAACHRTPVTSLDPAHSRACADELARERDTSLHIDGPYMSMPQRGDSVVIIVNDHEEWRGVYDPCVRPFPLSRVAVTQPGRAGAVTDTTTSLDIVRGAEAAARFRIATARAVAYVVHTTSHPH